MDLDQALELAELHHSEQVDKAGQPYIAPLTRAASMLTLGFCPQL